MKPIEVLVVDDSEVIRMFLAHLIDGDPRFHVAGVVDGGEAAVRFVNATPPDVVLMDVHMDGMDGFEAARRIMETRAVPIVMCSAVSDVHAVAAAFRIYEAGALALVEKPTGYGDPKHERLAREMLQTLRLMSEVKVVRRWTRGARSPLSTPKPRVSIDVVGIGASTGGPPALQSVLGGLDKDFPVPIVVVQHIASGFLPGLAAWLGQTTPMQVQIAAHGMDARPGHVYLAPDDLHLGMSGNVLRLERTPPENGVRPSVDYLFRSLARHHGTRAVGVLLTGMGKDGAQGLRELHRCGATTLAQDRETSVVYGMPGEAVALGAASQVLPIERVADALRDVVMRANGNR